MKRSVIFVVDRNAIYRNLIRYRLEKSGFTNVHAFSTREECLYRIRKSLRPGFLISSAFDSGQPAAGFLNAVMDFSPHTRVIFFDAFTDPQETGYLLSAGASDCVVSTSDPDAGISELVKNVTFLARDMAHSGLF
jgi:DNA-binding NarL/FixJ family response regulator